MTRRNVILITIDSLRRDFLGCYGYPKDISPTIDRLAREGLLFENAWANGPNTPHAFKSIMLGKYPLDEPGYGIFEKDDYLPYIFKNHGYYTVGVVAGNALVSRYYGYDKGFDAFVDFMERRNISVNAGNVLTRVSAALKQIPKLICYGMGDFFYIYFMAKLYDFLHKEYDNPMRKCLYPAVLNKLESVLENSRQIVRQNRIFLWVHFMDVHHPYSKPKDVSHGTCKCVQDLINFQDRAKGVLRKTKCVKLTASIRKMYEQSIREIDCGVEKLLSVLDRHQLLRDSSIFILSDHGDLLGEHGFLGHRRLLFSELLRIPAITYEYDSSKSGCVCSKAVSQRDLYELILASRERPVTKVISGHDTCQRDAIFSEMYSDEFGRMYLHQEKLEIDLFGLDETARRLYTLIIGDKKVTYHQSEEKYVFTNLSDDVLGTFSKDTASCQDMIKILYQHISDGQEARQISKRRGALYMAVNRINQNLRARLKNKEK